MLPGMTLRFLSRGEIADRLGVTLGTVKQWTTLPEPDVIVGRNQGWAADTIDLWWAQRLQDRGDARSQSWVPAPEHLSGSPAVDCGLGTVPEDLRTLSDDSSGREPASLGAATGSGAGTERTHRLGDPAISLDRRGVDRRSRGV